MKPLKLLALFLLSSLLAGNALSRDIKRELKFAPGTSSAAVSNAVVRGDRDLYAVTAKAGQTMEIRITAAENNAAFSIYAPGAKLVKEDGDDDIKGTTLPGAGTEDDAMTWQGKLPQSGKYWIVVGGTRGNAAYKLKISIR